MADDELNDEKIEWIDGASMRFKQVSTSITNMKFQMLPKWLDNVSYRYEQEFLDHRPKHLRYFNRGAIVRADFGVNMGSEFCGLHFAIVLNKHDNSRNRTLTVLPLTSHEKNGRFPLGSEIFNQTTQLLNMQIDNFQKRLIPLGKNADKLAKVQQSLDSKTASPSDSDNLRISLLETRKSLMKSISEFNNDLKKLIQVKTVYDRYNKQTYVRLNDITTISKYRLRYMNKYDPSGKIMLTSQQMSDISTLIQKLYLSEPNKDSISGTVDNNYHKI